MQIQALKYLSMNSMDLRKEIYNEVEKNPALEITDDSMEDWDYSDPKPSAELNEYTTVRTVSALGLEKANAFQDILENSPDNTETFRDHLKSQFDMLNIPENQKVLGEKLIYNLDKNGFHILAPVSFLNYETDTDEDLSACLNIIQNLDTDVNQSDARIVIYPSVIMAVTVENVNDFYEMTERKLQEYAANKDTTNDEDNTEE